MIADHLPALLVVIPLIAATAAAMLRSGRAAWMVALAASLLVLVMAGMIVERIARDGVISYWLGSWPPPWGIEYRIDAANAFVIALVAAIGAVIMVYARASIEREIPRVRQAWYYALYLLCLAGLLGMAATGDAFNVFVFIEIASISSYALIALGADRRALFAAYQYLVVGTVGATFFVIGVGFLYLMTGTLNIADLAERLPLLESRRPVLIGLAFIGVGLALKLALFPLHFWLPNAYAHAPSVATAFLAATATKVAIYLLLRFYFTAFGGLASFAEIAVPALWIALSLAAIVFASLAAIQQSNVKKLLAYSSVAQIGYITLGIGIGSKTGLIAAILHILNHGVMKGALFLIMGGIAYRAGSVTLAGMAGLGRSMPLAAAGLVVAGLSLVGTPGTVGFVSKWYLVVAALEKGWWWLAAIVIATSLLALFYMGRIVEQAYFAKPPPGAVREAEMPLSMLIPAWILVGACVYFGLDAGLTVEGATRAADALLGGAR